MEFCILANIGNVHLSAAKSASKLFQTCCCSWKLLLWTTGHYWSCNLMMCPGIFLKLIELMGQPFFIAILSCSIFLWSHLTMAQICIPVKSGSTLVRGPVKSGRKQTKDKGRGLDKELVRLELVTAWIQRLRTTSVDPLRRFRSRGWRWKQRQTETGVVTMADFRLKSTG